jgi:hypothetical protein
VSVLSALFPRRWHFRCDQSTLLCTYRLPSHAPPGATASFSPNAMLVRHCARASTSLPLYLALELGVLMERADAGDVRTVRPSASAVSLPIPDAPPVMSTQLPCANAMPVSRPSSSLAQASRRRCRW